jgi:hypothetical protein
VAQLKLFFCTACGLRVAINVDVPGGGGAPIRVPLVEADTRNLRCPVATCRGTLKAEPGYTQSWPR